MMGGYGGYGGMMSGYGFNPLGAIMMFVFWALIIGGIVWLVVWLARNANASTIAQRGTTTAANESPLDILKTRYARGEITKEQFDAIKQDLVA
ncbi:MAG: SHOCT domain-containing protein [Chloroflexi bacterium]|nr:SHOCT domain-containing protein [Chloroflexota bacterium]